MYRIQRLEQYRLRVHTVLSARINKAGGGRGGGGKIYLRNVNRNNNGERNKQARKEEKSLSFHVRGNGQSLQAPFSCLISLSPSHSTGTQRISALVQKY